MEEEQLISLKEAAVLSGLNSAHLRHLAERGILKARKIGRNWITTKDAVAEYLQNKELRRRDPYKHKRS